MTRVYRKNDYTKGSYLVSCDVYDKSTLVATFDAFVESSTVFSLRSNLHAKGYNLLSEQRLFVSRLSNIISGMADVHTLNNIASCLGPLPVALDLDF